MPAPCCKADNRPPRSPAESAAARGTDLRAMIRAGRIEPGMNFHQRAWAVCARVPRGRVTTYAAIARALGGKGYRAVGMAMNRNPDAPAVPCHRVVASDGRLNGYAGGLDAKAARLREEGVRVDHERVDLARYFHDPAHGSAS